MMHTPAATIARESWRLMAGNDFAAVAAVVAPFVRLVECWPEPLAARADRARLVETWP